MSYNIAAGSVVQATIRGILLDQVVMTTLHYRYKLGSPVFADGDQMLDNIFSKMNVVGGVLRDFCAGVPLNLGEIALDLQWIYPLRYRKKTYAPTVTFGSRPVSMVTNLAAVITVHGEAANRRTIACKHLPMSQDDADSGLLDGAFKADLAAYQAEIQADIVTTVPHTFEPIIWGKPRPAYTQCGVDHPALDALQTDITGAFIGDTVRVMRRRTVGRGI